MSHPSLSKRQPSEEPRDIDEEQRMYVRVRQTDPFTIALAKEAHSAGRLLPKQCAWCNAGVEDTVMYRCRNRRCLGGLPACAPCTLVAHEQTPYDRIEMWTGHLWRWAELRDLGYVYQEGHEGLPCPNPAPTTTSKNIWLSSGMLEHVTRGCNCNLD
ncbi:hypothetical protein C8R47DRAFT_1230728 [Mycena vitilis]|nr:hypothetical protein C8R47DRAFT_1230728 [Mycena vitilis]